MITIQTQISVFLDNRPGLLARISEAFSKKNVNITALSVADSVDYAVARMIVDQPKEAESLLAGMAVGVNLRDVVVMDLQNTPGALARVAETLAAAGINIEYAYGTTSQDNSGAIVLRTSDLEATINVLN